jgi:hypothetical protein
MGVIMIRFSSPAMGVALAAVLIALGSVGYSATGGNFILGISNQAGSQTRLTAPVAGATFRVENTSTSSTATGIAIATNANRPPFALTSSSKVTNLNADLLDGLHANQLARIALDTGPLSASAVTFSDQAQITIQAPQSGFVLVNGVIHFDTEDGDCLPCAGHVHIRNETTLTSSAHTAVTVADGQTVAAAVTWVFPVTTGAHTFSLEAGKFPGAATHVVDFRNAMLTGLFVPFGPTGTLALE